MKGKSPCNLIVLSLVTLTAATSSLTAYVLLDGGTTEVASRVRVGEVVQENIRVSSPLKETGVVWERIFHWQEAGYICLHFNAFDLSPGDYVEITSPDRQFRYRYEGNGKPVRGGEEILRSFWSSHIPGDTAIVRFFRAGSDDVSSFAIDKWSHGYPAGEIEDLLERDGGEDIEAICGGDDKRWARCYEGTTQYEKSRAVARLLIQGSWGCTGWLLGSEGHLMTNKHCISNQSEADNTDYEFMAEGATCETDCSGWFDCPGVVEATSGTLVRTDTDLDYSLILLPTNITPTYGYLQFRESLPIVGESIYIPQHPGGKGKQIAVFDDQNGGDCRVHSTDEPACFGGPGDIGYLCDTNNGSSGSPVIAAKDHLVIALHHCAYCPNRGVPVPPLIADMGNDLPADAVGAGVIPDIKANGLDGPLEIPEGNYLEITVSLEPGSLIGESVDVWLASKTPDGFYWFTTDSEWVQSEEPVRAYGGPIVGFPDQMILSTSGLPAGDYRSFFAVDDNMDGILNGTFSDRLHVTILDVYISARE